MTNVDIFNFLFLASGAWTLVNKKYENRCLFNNRGGHVGANDCDSRKAEQEWLFLDEGAVNDDYFTNDPRIEIIMGRGGNGEFINTNIIA